MEWITAPDFPHEVGDTVKNLDLAVSEIEKVVETLTSIPLSEAQATVRILYSPLFALILSPKIFS